MPRSARSHQVARTMGWSPHLTDERTVFPQMPTFIPHLLDEDIPDYDSRRLGAETLFTTSKITAPVFHHMRHVGTVCLPLWIWQHGCFVASTWHT